MGYRAANSQACGGTAVVERYDHAKKTVCYRWRFETAGCAAWPADTGRTAVGITVTCWRRQEEQPTPIFC